MDKTQKKGTIQEDHPQRSDIQHFSGQKYQIYFDIVDNRMKKSVVSGFFIELSTIKMTKEGKGRIRKMCIRDSW